MTRNRRKRARFPSGKTFDDWRSAASTVPASTQQALRALEWIRRAENLAVVDPSKHSATPTSTTDSPCPGSPWRPRRTRDAPPRR